MKLLPRAYKHYCTVINKFVECKGQCSHCIIQTSVAESKNYESHKESQQQPSSI